MRGSDLRITEHRATRELILLFHQFFIQCHGFDMRGYSMSRFQAKVRKRFPGDAGDERRSNIQQHIDRRLIRFPDLQNRGLKDVQYAGRGIGPPYNEADVTRKNMYAYSFAY